MLVIDAQPETAEKKSAGRQVFVLVIRTPFY